MTLDNVLQVGVQVDRPGERREPVAPTMVGGDVSSSTLSSRTHDASRSAAF